MVGEIVGRSVIIYKKKGGNIHFHAPIRALVFNISTCINTDIRIYIVIETFSFYLPRLRTLLASWSLQRTTFWDCSRTTGWNRGRLVSGLSGFVASKLVYSQHLSRISDDSLMRVRRCNIQCSRISSYWQLSFACLSVRWLVGLSAIFSLKEEQLLKSINKFLYSIIFTDIYSSQLVLVHI